MPRREEGGIIMTFKKPEKKLQKGGFGPRISPEPRKGILHG